MTSISTDYSTKNEEQYSIPISSDKFGLIEGVWEDRIQGIVFNFHRGEHQQPSLTRYQITPKSLIQEQPPIILKVKENHFKDIQVQGKNLVISGKQELIRSSSSLQAYPEIPASPTKTFEVLAMLLKQHYAFSTVRGVNLNTLLQEYQTQVSDDMNPAALFKLLVSMLATFKDNHIALAQGLNEESEKYFGFELRPSFQKELDLREINVDSVTQQAVETIKKHYLNDVESSPDNLLFWGRLKQSPSIGYVNILSLESRPKELQDSLDRMIKSFENVKQVIFDVRFNQGGSDETAKAILSRFTNKERLYSYVQTYYDGGQLTPALPQVLNPSDHIRISNEEISIIVLTSPITASAGEIFTLMASALPGAKRMGETTMGILSDQFARKLPNGWWVMLSNELRFGVNKQLLEAKGISPDIEIPFPFDSGKDPAIDAVLLRN